MNKVRATEVLSGWAHENGRSIIFTSTDLVFDGARSWYREDDEAAPNLEYGRTKLAAESPGTRESAAAWSFGSACSMALRERLGWPISTRRSPTCVQVSRRPFFEDEFRTPLDYATAAASILVRLVGSGVTGIIHAGGPERVSRFELMQRAARVLGADPSLVRANRRADAPGAEPRPADVSLDTTLLRSLLPDLASCPGSKTPSRRT